MIKKIRDIAIVVLVALTVWELLVRVTGVPSFILPGPLRVGRAAVVAALGRRQTASAPAAECRRQPVLAEAVYAD